MHRRLCMQTCECSSRLLVACTLLHKSNVHQKLPLIVCMRMQVNSDRQQQEANQEKNEQNVQMMEQQQRMSASSPMSGRRLHQSSPSPVTQQDCHQPGIPALRFIRAYHLLRTWCSTSTSCLLGAIIRDGAVSLLPDVPAVHALVP